MSQKIEARPTSTSLQWTCSRCGTQNITGDACPNCGAFREVSAKGGASAFSPSYAAPTFNPGAVPLAAASDAFIFNNNNRAFVEGRSQTIARGNPWLVITIMMVIFTAILGVMSFPDWSTQQALNAQGHITQGKVTGHRTYITTSKNSHTTHYMLTTTFMATAGSAEGRSFSFEQEVSSGTYFRLGTGASATLSFLPDNPNTARLAGADADNVNQWLNVAALVSFGLLLASIIMQWRYARRTQRLVATGHLITGEVVKCTGSSSKNGYAIYLTYAFRSPAGELLTRKENTYRGDLRSRDGSLLPPAGTPVTVLYADDKTFRVM